MKVIDLRVIIDFLGLLQGIIFGIILIFFNKKAEKASFFLGLFVIAFCIDFLPQLIDYLELPSKYPRLQYLPLQFSYFLFPLFYLYVQEVSILSDQKKNYWVLFPAILVTVVNFVFFALPDYLLYPIFQKYNWCLYLNIFAEAFGVVIGFFVIRFVNLHIRTLREQYTNTIYKTLKWVRTYAIIGVAFTCIVPILNQFISNYLYSFTISLLNCILLYWVCIRGIMQNNVTPLILSLPNEHIEEIELAAKQSTVPKNNTRTHEILKLVEEFMVLQKAYSRPDLTIIDVAEYTEVHPKLISTLINSQLNQNFNNYVNTFRIEKAKELLKSQDAERLTVDGIGREVGFKSKSSFYTAFKHFTNTTPLQFKEANL